MTSSARHSSPFAAPSHLRASPATPVHAAHAQVFSPLLSLLHTPTSAILQMPFPGLEPPSRYPVPRKLLLTRQDPTQMSHFSYAPLAGLASPLPVVLQDTLESERSSYFCTCPTFTHKPLKGSVGLLFAPPVLGQKSCANAAPGKYLTTEGINAREKAQPLERRLRFVPEMLPLTLHTFCRGFLLKAVFCVVLMLSNQVSRKSSSEASAERQVSGSRATRPSRRKRPRPFRPCVLCVRAGKITPTGSGDGEEGVRSEGSLQPSQASHSRAQGGFWGSPPGAAPPGAVSGAPRQVVVAESTPLLSWDTVTVQKYECCNISGGRGHAAGLRGALPGGRLHGRAMCPQGRVLSLRKPRGQRESGPLLAVREAGLGRAGSGAHRAWEGAGRSPGISQSSGHS